MAQRLSYQCDHCGCRVEDQDCPVVVYLVAGSVTGDAVQIDTDQLHPYVVDLLAQPIARRDFCARCVDEAMFGAFLYTHPDDHNPETIAALEARAAKLRAALEAAEGRLQELASATTE